MGRYFIRRVLYAVPALLVISFISFLLIQLPPGTFADTVAAEMMESASVNESAIRAIEERYGLNQPIMVQYWKWISGILLRGDFGESFIWNRPVAPLMWERLGLTLILTSSAFIFVCVVSVPIGIFSAVRQYSVGDYVATSLGFLGLAVPSFLFALILMYVGFRYFDTSIGGFFSPEFARAEWSWARVADLLSNLWMPMLAVGLAGTASLIRIVRANLLDELLKPYVAAARAKGLSELGLLLKYPVRLALIPFVATVGWMLPQLVSGATIVSVVMSLPTTGPMLLRSLLGQDMYLAASFIMMLSGLTVIGTVISDVLLALVDPRIRFT
ncbi:MAG: ABC transporter permease [Spirochaetaceae bacterium]|nr:ABC transporter permease [Spirochaetaceae bacterium]